MANYEMICKHRTVFTPEEILEMELDEEKELSAIKREYTLMNRDHWNLLMGTDPKMIKFKGVLNILKKEKMNVSSDLDIAMSTSKVRGDREIEKTIKTMVQENKILHGKIKQRLTDIRETEDQIRRIGRDVQRLRNSRLTDFLFQQKNMESLRTVEKLENRLDCQQKKIGVITAENLKLREQIDHLLNERASFNIKWEHQIMSMFRRKKCLLDLFQQATVAYDKRGEWVASLDALRHKVYNDLQINREEMTKLQYLLDDNNKLSNFIETKQQMRRMLDLEQIAASKKREKFGKMTIQRSLYSTIISDIQDLTGQTDINSITVCFAKQQTINDSQFTLISHMNIEIEEIGKTLTTLSTEIEKRQQIRDSMAELQKSKFEKLASTAEQLEEEIAQQMEEIQRKDGCLGEIFNGIARLFGMCKCDNSPFLALLGENSSINGYNVLLHLEAIQAKLYEMVLQAIFKQKMEKRHHGADGWVIQPDKHYPPPLDLSEIVDENPCPLCVEQEMVSDVIDILQFAQTKEEVAQFLEQRLQLPDGMDRLHSVSNCNLPKSREIVQKRYQ
ncbi:uncharacterized protein LOC108741695 [Agrilus planipennis]|uniref:Uncharacterized protein LOC108741695 n=1 Tax=Agrilus planipennis TaxID=224129 RepID=A0A1W4XI11_AGRPL|nr:uncharacterized protein LOC108741695 [Agrilus planipennis]